MAKRKRLTPANPVFLGSEASVPRQMHSAPIADVAGEASTRAALDEVSETLTRARSEGRLVIPVSLDQIDHDYLVRDRVAVDDEEMEVLINSLRARGQQAPIEVAPLEAGRFSLISGWRRCTALKRLFAKTGEERFAYVQALIRQPDQSATAYLSMIEENEIRVGLSFYERARIVTRTVENRVYSSESEALRGLFASASRAKRSKIKSFVVIVKALDGALRFPQAIGERMGLQLAKALQDDSRFRARMLTALKQEAPDGAEAEQAVISTMLKQRKTAPEVQQSNEIAPGLALKIGRNSLTFKGEAMNDDLQARLIAWLKAELG